MENDNLKNTYFDSHKVFYEGDSEDGVKYLRDHLDFEEARVFFEQAGSKGHAEFEDTNGHNYILTKNSDSSYKVERK